MGRCILLLLLWQLVFLQPAGYTKAHTYPSRLRTSNGRKTFYIPVPKPSWPSVRFPFAPDHPVRCTQGHDDNNPAHSHFYDNCLFALDLSSPEKSEAGKIYAPMSGIAYVFDNCKHGSTSATAENACKCGNGFGNYVRILDRRGVYSMCGHLSKVMVKTGQSVKAGQLIGIEGNSGMAGQRHLHLSVHRVDSSRQLSEYAVPGESTPFIMYLRYGDCKKAKNVCSFDMRLSRNFNTGPLMYGIEL